jgi:hypothetical protein
MINNDYNDAIHGYKDIKFKEIETDEFFSPTFTYEVFCTLQFSATHCWPDCPFDDVAFLRDPHRHVFHIKAYKQVSHTDRDVEFIRLKMAIERYLQFKYVVGDFGAKSCEMLAEELILRFNLSKCEVSEDNENGSLVTRLS